jgi:hypothetical protein
MKRHLPPLLIICSILFLTHLVLEKWLKIAHPFVDAYLDPLLAMPIILPLLEYERAYLFKRNTIKPFTLFEVIITTLYVSIISEVVFPWLSTRFIYDTWDFACFFAGAALHIFVSHRKSR